MVESQEVQRLKRVIAQLKAGQQSGPNGTELQVDDNNGSDVDEHEIHGDWLGISNL